MKQMPLKTKEKNDDEIIIATGLDGKQVDEIKKW